jgi:hypothetical protein
VDQAVNLVTLRGSIGGLVGAVLVGTLFDPLDNGLQGNLALPGGPIVNRLGSISDRGPRQLQSQGANEVDAH